MCSSKMMSSDVAGHSQRQRYAVLNSYGNAGKTTLVRHVLVPRMPDAVVYSLSLESKWSDWDLQGMLGDLMTKDRVIVDVAISKYDAFVRMLARYSGAHDLFDCYVLPVTPESVPQERTLCTVSTLNGLGVPAEKIQVVFNQVERGTDVGRAFARLFQAREAGSVACTLSREAVLYRHAVIDELYGVDRSLSDLLADTTEEDRVRAVTSAMRCMFARGSQDAVRNLDQLSRSLAGLP